MKKTLSLLLFSFSILFAQDILNVKIDVLKLQKIIIQEEKLSYMYEQYLLNEYKYPTISNLQTQEYLGEHYYKKNIFGEDIDFFDNTKAQIKYAIKKDVKDYMHLLYKRDIYREYTSVFVSFNEQNVDANNSYIQIILNSKKAKNIFNILKTDFINKNCLGDIENEYCIYDENSIRWYNNDKNYIEYNLEEFNNGNIFIEKESQLSDTKLDDLSIGSFVYTKNGNKYYKIANNNYQKISK